MKRIKTLTLAAAILTLTLVAFPHHASAASDHFSTIGDTGEPSPIHYAAWFSYLLSLLR